MLKATGGRKFMALCWINDIGNRNQNGLGREDRSMHPLRSTKLRKGSSRKESFRTWRQV